MTTIIPQSWLQYTHRPTPYLSICVYHLDGGFLATLGAYQVSKLEDKVQRVRQRVLISRVSVSLVALLLRVEPLLNLDGRYRNLTPDHIPPPPHLAPF